MPETAVIERKLRPAAIPRNNPGLGTIGSFQLIAELSRAPTVIFVEARDRDDRRVILQLARLRAAKSPIEAVERHYFEQRVAEATAIEAEDKELGLIAHGAIDRLDGTRVLYWALPWRDEARALGRRLSRPLTGVELCDVGIAIAQRLAKRHERGRCDPLLSEQSVLILGLGRADVAGAPIYLHFDWLDAEMLPVRLAPEEAMTLHLRPSGDLWRLGHALEAITLANGEVPGPLARCLSRLKQTDPTDRSLRATEVIVELEAARSEIHSSEGLKAFCASETTQLGALGPDAVTTLMLNATADSTRIEATYIPPEIDVSATEVVAPEQDLATVLEVTEAPSREESTERNFATNIRVWSEMSPALKRELDAGEGVLEAPTLHPDTMRVYPRMPMPLTPHVASSVAPLIEPSKADGIDDELRAALRPNHVRRVIIAALLALAVCGAGVLLWRALPDPKDRIFVTSADEVVLDVSPAGAMVIAELDGRVLGPAPLSFMIAPNVERALLVMKEGYEPQRIVLPDRGRVSTKLSPITEQNGCLVEIDAPRGAALEGFGTDIGGPERYAIRGSAVVRGRPNNNASGAWLVRCPSRAGEQRVTLKARPKVESHALIISTHQGAPVYADGVMAGIETWVGGAFTELRMEVGGRSIARWLATDSDASVELMLDRP
jgi:hypothetical protein